MKEQILKLAKRLNNFTVDDLQIITGKSEDEMIDCLEDLIETGQIKKLSGKSYTFVKSLNIQPFTRSSGFPRLINLTDDDIEEYNATTQEERKSADKYLKLIEASNGLRGKQLVRFVDQWNLKNPTMKTSVTAINVARKKLLEGGIKGILGKNLDRLRARKIVFEPVYDYFKEFYMSPKMLSAAACLDMAVEKYMETDPYFDKSTLAKPQTYRKRVQQDYTVEEVNFRRSNYLSRELSINLKLNSTFFKDAAKDFMENYSKNNCKKSTLDSYKNNIKVHLLPYFGNKKLAEITEDLIEEFKQEKLNQGLSAKSLNNILTLLISIIRNYDKDYTAPKLIIERESIKLNILTEYQISLLLKTAKSEDPEIYYVLLTALSTGMTRSEIFGLTWGKIGWLKKQIDVDKMVYKGKLIPHKNNNSKRVIDISKKYLEILKEIKPKAKYHKNVLLFQNEEGNPVDLDNFAKRKLDPFMKKIKLGNITFTDLRDTYANILIKQNLPLTYIQKQLGHSSVQVTAERYKNLIPNIKKSALELI